jgi:4-carboxymuconolactone decarboxylase
VHSRPRCGTIACEFSILTRKERVIMPRVAPITGKSDVAAEHHDVVDGVLKVFGQIRGPFSMLLHSPELAEQMLGLGNFYRDKSIVAPKDRSLAILVGVRERQGAYVWAAQVNAARRAGVREEAIDVIRARKDPAGLPVEEREIITYAEQLIRNNRVDQAAFDALKNRHGVQWLVELTAAANYYGILCGIVNAFEVPAPPDSDKLPA